MHAPLFSTITVFTEILVSCAVFFAFYQGYKKNKFPTIIVSIALLYEILFNISYMASRVPGKRESYKGLKFITLLAIFHGILSLIMFIALIIFMVVAWRKYSQGENFFKKHQILSSVFLFFWSLSVVSGISFYFITYF